MRKVFLSITCALLAVFGLASCGEDSTELKTQSMFGGSDPHAAEYQKIIKDYEEKSGVKIKDNSATSNEIWKTSVLASFYSGSEADVLFYFTGAVAKPLTENNYVVSVEEIRKEYPDYAKNISPSVLDPYAVPLKGFVEGMFINTALFTGDLAPYLAKDNWTWAEFLDVCSKLKASGKVPVALGAEDEPHYWIEHLVLNSLGKSAFTAIPTAADCAVGATGAGAETASKWVNALALMKELADAGVFGATDGNRKAEIAKQEFKDGNAGMYLDGSWFSGQIDNKTTCKPENLRMMPFPKIPTDKGGKNEAYMQSGFTSAFYISRKAWNDPAKREAAVNFVSAMTSSESINKFCVVGGGAPADPTVKIANATPFQDSMNTMAGRTVDASLPLSDSCKAQTFPELVKGGNYFLTGNKEKIREVLGKFAALQ